VAADCDLPMVPALYQGTPALDGIDVRQLADGQSTLAPAQIREGCVIESVDGPRRKAKYVGVGYLLRKEA
jgi:hypothetical protein